ncbi:MAG: hypothetical protein ACO1RA_12965 [Planctomycetaceae bacterium]
MTPNGWRLWHLLKKSADATQQAAPEVQAWGRTIWWLGTGTLATLFLLATAIRLSLGTSLLERFFPAGHAATSAGLLLFSAACCGLLLVLILRLVRLAWVPSISTFWELLTPGASLLGLFLLLSEGEVSRIPLLAGLGVILLSEGAFWGYLVGNFGRATDKVLPASQLPPPASSLPEDEFRDSPLAELPKFPKFPLDFEGEPPSEEFSEESASLYQRWTRQRDEEAQQETLHGILRADFAAGDPLVILHVSFCPVLDSIPELQCEVSGDLSPEAPDATIKITLAETFGARIEVRLQQKPPAPLSLFVELFGTAPLK